MLVNTWDGLFFSSKPVVPMGFCLFLYIGYSYVLKRLFKYILLIMLLQLSHFFLLFIPLHPAPPLPPAFPPQPHSFMSMGRTYKFFGFSTSYSILNLPLSCLFYTYRLCFLLPVPFPPFYPLPYPTDNPPCDLHFYDSVPVLVVCFCFWFVGGGLFVCLFVF